MSKTKSFSPLTQEQWTCVQNKSSQEHGTVYDPPAPSNQGVSTTDTPVGKVVVSYDYDPDAQAVTYTIDHKPIIVPEDKIWSGIEKTVKECGGG